MPCIVQLQLQSSIEKAAVLLVRTSASILRSRADQVISPLPRLAGKHLLTCLLPAPAFQCVQSNQVAPTHPYTMPGRATKAPAAPVSKVTITSDAGKHFNNDILQSFNLS